MEEKSKKTKEQNKELKVTSISALKSYEEGKIVELPSFGEGQSFVARLRRPSVLKMAENGDIPNPLLGVAEEMLTGQKTTKSLASGDNLKNIIKFCKVVAAASFIEPTWEELEEAEVELTDDQFMFIFNYAQRGVQALSNFR